MSVVGKHALVTGGGSGVGAVIAMQMAEAGAKVTITGRRAPPLEAVAAGHASILALTADVTDAASLAAMAEAATAQWGAFDIVVANAGVAKSLPFARMTDDDLSAMLDVNVKGVFNTWQVPLSAMMQAGWGRLIAIASTASLKGYPYVAGYCAAKHAVIGLTRSLALEMATSGITVNAICPGYTETPLLEETLDTIVAKTGRTREAAAAALVKSNPQGRFIRPSEIGQAVLWLCSEGARSVTGQALSISGGEM